MNKHLLIVICDFLLLSMLALARFDKSSPPDPSVRAKSAPMVEAAKGDVVDSLKESLASEADAKAILSKQLADEAANLQREKEGNESLQQEKSRLLGEQERLERLRDELEAEKMQMSGQISLTQKERDKLRDEIISAQAREKLIQDQLANREKDLKDAQANILTLQEAKGAAETDKALLAQKLETAQSDKTRLEGEVETLRSEKAQATEQAAKLAENVSQLAQAQEVTGNIISESIRQASPLSLNTIYDSFRKNRAAIRFKTREANLIGESEDVYVRYTVLVKRADGRILALCENEKTPMRIEALNSLLAVNSEMILPGNKTMPVQSAMFLKADTRIVAFPADGAERGKGLDCFDLEDNPLKYSTAVVVTAGGERYGEAPIRVVAKTSRYIEVQTSISNKLFGSFSPSEGDMVFSLKGKLIGFMVGSDRAICLSDLAEALSLDLGDKFDAGKAKETAKALAQPSATK
jgi:hypothetical protein